MTAIPHPIHITTAAILRWAARLSSLASIGVILLFAFGGHEPGTPRPPEWIALACFPIGVIIGMLIAWWRELPGSIISLASLAAFYFWYTLYAHRIPTGPYFLIFSFPAFLFLAAAIIRSRETPSSAPQRR